MIDPDEASAFPTAKGGLERVESPDGLIVYDEATDRVHHLNQTAAVILELCDGTQTPDQIATTVTRMFDMSEVPMALTRECLQQLFREHLITPFGPPSPQHRQGTP